MGVYSTGQWVVLFFLYGFLGWIWECCWVSAHEKRWVNRGFLHGPFLPIYAFGAIIILFVTLPVQGSYPLMFVFAMVSATALELVTGWGMERLFHMRYWDYSDRPVQLGGYICLRSSLAWGVLGILVVKVIHPPVAAFLAEIPAVAIDPLGHALVAALAVDTTLSARAAFDLRDTLERLSAENEDIRRLLRRAEIAQTFAEDDLRKFRERVNGSREAWEARAKALRGSGAQRAAAMLESYRAMNRELLDTLETIADSVSGALPHPAQLAPDDHSFVSELRRARMAAKQGVALRAEAYSGMLRQLRGNPGAVSRMAEAMKLLKTMERESRGKKPTEAEKNHDNSAQL